MRAYLAARGCLLIPFVALFVACGWLLCIAAIIGELSREARVRNEVGPGWEAEYEAHHGPLSRAHTMVAMASVGTVAIPALTLWLYRSIRPKQNSGRSRERSETGIRHWFRSQFGGFRYYRRNGTVAIALGVLGILASVFLAVFRAGIFEHHSDEVVLSIAVFIPSYICVLAGCSWWLKAKEWNDAVIFIGMMPLAIVFIPFVRLLFLAEPMLRVVAMVMMPLILVVIVLVLPDKGRSSRRRHHWERDEY
jgi:hypothetical protein